MVATDLAVVGSEVPDGSTLTPTTDHLIPALDKV